MLSLRINLCSFLWIGALIGAIGGSGGAEESELLSTGQAIRLAFEKNRELRIADLEIERAAIRLRWSGRLSNPELEISALGDGIGRNEGESGYEVAFSQSFPLTSRLRDEKNLRQSQVLLAEAEIAERRRQLAAKIDHAIIELLNTRRKSELQGGLDELNSEITTFLKDRAEVGEASPLEAIQSELNGRMLKQSIASLKAEELRQRLALNQLIGIEPDDRREFTGDLDLPDGKPDQRAKLEDIFQKRPDYVLASAKIDEAAAAIALEHSKRWEDVSLRLFLEGDESTDEPVGLERNTFAGVGVSIPLPLRQRNQEGIAQAQVDREAAEKSVDALTFRIRSDYEEAFQQRLAAYQLAAEAAGEVIGLAEKNLEEFRKANQQGQASLLQVQRAQEQVLELRTAALEFITNYHRADARLRKITGSYPGLSLSSSSSNSK